MENSKFDLLKCCMLFQQEMLNKEHNKFNPKKPYSESVHSADILMIHVEEATGNSNTISTSIIHIRTTIHSPLEFACFIKPQQNLTIDEEKLIFTHM